MDIFDGDSSLGYYGSWKLTLEFDGDSSGKSPVLIGKSWNWHGTQWNWRWNSIGDLSQFTERVDIVGTMMFNTGLMAPKMPNDPLYKMWIFLKRPAWKSA